MGVLPATATPPREQTARGGSLKRRRAERLHAEALDQTPYFITALARSGSTRGPDVLALICVGSPWAGSGNGKGNRRLAAVSKMERAGIEPATSGLQSLFPPNPAKAALRV